MRSCFTPLKAVALVGFAVMLSCGQTSEELILNAKSPAFLSEPYSALPNEFRNALDNLTADSFNYAFELYPTGDLIFELSSNYLMEHLTLEQRSTHASTIHTVFYKSPHQTSAYQLGNPYYYTLAGSHGIMHVEVQYTQGFDDTSTNKIVFEMQNRSTQRYSCTLTLTGKDRVETFQTTAVRLHGSKLDLLARQIRERKIPIQTVKNDTALLSKGYKVDAERFLYLSKPHDLYTNDRRPKIWIGRYHDTQAYPAVYKELWLGSGVAIRYFSTSIGKLVETSNPDTKTKSYRWAQYDNDMREIIPAASHEAQRIRAHIMEKSHYVPSEAQLKGPNRFDYRQFLIEQN